MGTFVEKVKQAGVIGAGGAGFPTHVKLSAEAEFLIINGVECEPLLHVDQHLAAAHADTIADTVETIRQQLKARKAFIALKEKYVDAKAALEKTLSAYPDLELALFPSVYPMGDEHVLVYETVNRVVPAGGIPLDVGVVVMNVETVWNVSRAILGEPVVDTFLTVVGEVPEQMTLKAPVGTSVAELLDALGIDSNGLKLVEGGPMMGNRIELDFPIQKTTKGLFLLPATNPVVYRREQSVDSFLKIARSACCHCNFCTENCPRYLLGHPLEPHRIMWGVSVGLTEDFPAFQGAQYCCECGICELFACPMEISPRQIIQLLKRNSPVKPAKIAEPEVSPLRETRRVPTNRLEARLAIGDYHAPAPWNDVRIEPEAVTISLKPHIGAPATPIVSTGDSVRRGDKIAEIPEGKLGATVHASIDGHITEISPEFIRIET